MEYLSDSDPENSLPLLPDSAIDLDLLGGFFAVASRDTRERLRRESRGSPLQRIFDTADTSAETAGVDPFRIPSSSPRKEARNGPSQDLRPSMDNYTAIPTQTLFISENHLSENSIQPLDTSNSSQLAVDSAIHSTLNLPLIPEINANPEQNTFARPSRSLRRRTFASVHPYIADQADYLEICSIESMNEMFSAESDLAGVVKTLNHLYLRKKKRYPDEDRYKSANFYIHLGRSKVMALQGDADSQAQNNVSSSQLTDENFAPEAANIPAGDNPSSSQLNFSLPRSPDFLSELNPNNSSSDDEELYLRKTPRVAESVSGSSSESESASLSESEDEQMIRIGGRYRKLSKILRGVLPESAKRLSIFQSKEPSKKRKTRAKELIPRKGLAQRKFGSVSTQSAQLEQELKHTGDHNVEEFVSTLIHEEQSYLADLPLPTTPSARQRSYSPKPLIAAHLSSGDESDAASEVFSDTGSPLFNTSRFDNTSFEADIEPLQVVKPMLKKSSRTNLQSAPRNKTKKLVTRGPKHTMKRRTAPKLPKRHFHQRSTLESDTKSKISAAFSSGRSKATEEKLVKQNSTKTKSKPKIQQHIGRFTSLDFKRTPTTSTFVYEIESSNKFVRKSNRETNFSINHFSPTKQALFATAGLAMGNMLLCACDFLRPDFLTDGYNYFPREDSVSFTLLKKQYTLGLYQIKESRDQVNKLLSVLKYLMPREETYLNDFTRNELSNALIQLMKWLIISRDDPSEDTFWWMAQILNTFSKVQVREVRRFQVLVQSQLLFIYWLLCRLQMAYNPDVEFERQQDLLQFTLDYWLALFLTFLAEELRLSKDSSMSDKIYDSIHAVRLIFKADDAGWWLSISSALSDVITGNYSDLIDLLYSICHMVSHTIHNWTPFLTILTLMRRERVAEGHHHYLDACLFVSQRLGWPLEEKVLISVYSSLACKKFANFDDEEDTPPIISGAVRSVAELPDSTVFERFLVMIYRYVADLESEREVKRLISKLLPSSALEFHKSHRMRAVFVNRVNLILLLSQVSTVDLGPHFSSTIALIANSDDQKAFSRAADAVGAYFEMAQLRRKPLPVEAMVLCMNSRAHSTITKMMKLMGGLFLATESRTDSVSVILRVFNQFDLDSARDSEKSKIISLLMYSMLEIRDNTSQEIVVLIETFQKRLLSFLSRHMSKITPQNPDLLREVVELSIQLWNVTAQIVKNRHWNVMMFQKYLFMGNDTLRNRYICLFALEYLQGNQTTRDDDILSIDKIFVRALCAPVLDRYSLGLFALLFKESRSIFCLSFRGAEITSLFALLANKLHIVDAAIRTLYASARIPLPEKDAFVKHLLEVLELNYNKMKYTVGFPEMCKHILEVIQLYGRSGIKELSQFWTFADKLGLTSARRRASWDSLSEKEKLSAYHRELELSLHYDSNALERMESSFPEMETTLMYALLEIYIAELTFEKSYWCHISSVLRAIQSRLQNFQAPLKDGSLLRLVRALRSLALYSSKQTPFEVDSISTCIFIINFGYLTYNGFREQDEIRELAIEFFSNIDMEPLALAPEIGRQLSQITVSQLNPLDRKPDEPTPQQIYTANIDRINKDDHYETELNSLIETAQNQFSTSNDKATLDFEFIF